MLKKPCAELCREKAESETIYVPALASVQVDSILVRVKKLTCLTRGDPLVLAFYVALNQL